MKDAGQRARSSLLGSGTPPGGHDAKSSWGGSSAWRLAKQSTPDERTRLRCWRASASLGPGTAGWQCGYCPSMIRSLMSQFAQPRCEFPLGYVLSKAKSSVTMLAQLALRAEARLESEKTVGVGPELPANATSIEWHVAFTVCYVSSGYGCEASYMTHHNQRQRENPHPVHSAGWC